ncbi:MAG TPA: Fe-S-containing protein [Nitrospirota bacterium]|nr:Fe-S-containing protein [Nitrospirota bacterium]
MSKCGKCGKEAKPNAKFCQACGAGLLVGAGALKDKKARVMAQERPWKKQLAIAGAVLLVVALGWTAKGAYMAKKMGDRPAFPARREESSRLAAAERVNERSGSVSVPLAALEDGKAHFFAFAMGGKTITFFAMKAADGSIRTAFDACMACNHAKLGYRPEGGLVVCNNCGMGFKPAEIGVVSGGCNPIPVNKSVDGQMIVLKAKDLEEGAKYF